MHAGTARLADKIRQVCNQNQDKHHAFERLSWMRYVWNLTPKLCCTLFPAIVDIWFHRDPKGPWFQGVAWVRRSHCAHINALSFSSRFAMVANRTGGWQSSKRLPESTSQYRGPLLVWPWAKGRFRVCMRSSHGPVNQWHSFGLYVCFHMVDVQNPAPVGMPETLSNNWPPRGFTIQFVFVCSYAKLYPVPRFDI